MTGEPLTAVVVGHTNVGKTSLLRALTRQRDFGEVSDRPGTTRHAQVVDLRVAGEVLARFTDTPGLEDSIALHAFLAQQPGETRLEKIRAFLAGPEARAAFEQEAKVLRALLDAADCAMLVMDTRAPVLPKYRAEIEILGWCARPIMPVLNFTADAGSRVLDWQAMLRECSLHAQAQFDVVAPLHGSEQQLYADLATLLPPARRSQVAAIGAALTQAAHEREQAGWRIVAGTLIDVAAMRRQVAAEVLQDAARRQQCVLDFRSDLRAHVQAGMDALLALHAFRAGDAELSDLPELEGRWKDDLFDPELLAQAGMRLGLGSVLGAGVGVIADLMLAGLSLGAATTLGATVGGALSGGWRPLWRKLENRMQGVQELTAEDALLWLLARHLHALALALASRSHAAQDALRVPLAPIDGADTEPMEKAAALPRALLSTLSVARSHPDWERKGRRARGGEERERLEQRLASQLAAGPALVAG
ncbi:GTPase/DUF3482 domain-containing protein [Comamonas badia]|uniref:GTPase/DUF3482 domain-containing protein n=1 Tax=Comamonas badia TaxID=265291 RepID=UPI0004078165|nr:GTPase/DUF3482 domain-containing protein [Comamonas badia]